MPRFDSILVANRGEIALRVMRTAKALGYRTIAVFSQADRDAPHVRFADAAVCIGPAPAGESYLLADRIIDAARETGAQAIHPGYGFLSENARFAEACEQAGLVFIGPSAFSIDLMGNKAAAKRHMIAAGVPCVPGYEGADQTDETLISAAGAIGFPIMVKATAGGGGRGMRLVRSADALPGALSAARSEALNAFGSGDLILEKAVLRPRHVEIQVIADAHGNAIHLGERDCSVQRRHQKVIEEAPCPVMTDTLRAAMGQAAVDAALSIGYRGAGTVEFLLDAEGAFHFLEMNTRLQVEHPVTEMITGLDLVALQIGVAQGEPLPLAQADLRLDGHAIEARLYAEDPTQDFLPMTGRVALWEPVAATGVRVDSGIETGQDISPHYDPMIAKITAWGPDRATATARLVQALDGSRLFGTPTNKGFLSAILGKESFRQGTATTAFIAEEFSDEDLTPPTLTPRTAMIAAVLHFEAARTRSLRASLGVHPELAGWGSPGYLTSTFGYLHRGQRLDVVLTARDRAFHLQCGDDTATIRVERIAGAEARLQVDGRVETVGFLAPDRVHLHLEHAGQVFDLTNALEISGTLAEEAGGGRITAPMHGTLLQITVSVGEAVQKGQSLATLEAMKMQHAILAEIDGTVSEIHATANTQIGAGDVILVITPPDE